MPIRNRFSEMLPELSAFRRDLHAHPELGFDCFRTASRVAQALREMGCDQVVEGIAKSGVVGVIKGRQAASGKVVGLRADMDALPIHEATGLPHASTIPGKMHACGHDGHTTMLLGAARYLAETRNFDGTVVLIFQPAEEGGGGAKVMCDEGLMERFGIHEVYGMHNRPGHDFGEFVIRSGPFYASADEFEVSIEGRGGHAAKPHDCIDPTVAAAQVVLALQTVVSRNTDPVAQVVVSVCTFRTESEAFNVIPQRVLLKGTVRTLTPETRDMAQTRITDIITHTAAAHGARAEVNYMRGYPVMVNHAAETEVAMKIGRGVTGRCIEGPYNMGGEDFAYMLEERPGAYIVLGAGPGAKLHHPEYDFNDEIIPIGASWFVGMVEERMPAP